MRRFTLTIVYSDTLEEVLLLWNNKLHNWNFPGGKVKDGEDFFSASLRELREETGIVPDTLHIVNKVSINSQDATYVIPAKYEMLITSCIVNKHDVHLPSGFEGKWVKHTSCHDLVLHSYGFGSCFVYATEALHVLQLNEKERIALNKISAD